MQFSTLAVASLFALPAFSLALPKFGAEQPRVEEESVSLDARAGSQYYGVTINSINSDGRATQNILSKPITAVVDSGSQMSYFPIEITRSLYEVLNANPSFAINQKYYTDCNITSNLLFDFGATQIKVPAYYFLKPIEQYVNPVQANINFPHNSCYVGIQTVPGDEASYAVLGQNIISATNIVYDSRTSQVTLNQA